MLAEVPDRQLRIAERNASSLAMWGMNSNCGTDEQLLYDDALYGCVEAVLGVRMGGMQGGYAGAKLRVCGSTVGGKWPLEFGAQMLPAERGSLSTTFQDELKNDGGGLAMWPDHSDPATTASALAVPNESYVFAPMWFVASFSSRGMKGLWGQHPPEPPQQVIGHVHQTIGDGFVAKMGIVQALGHYNWSIAEKANGDGLFFASHTKREIPKILSLHPKLKLSMFTASAEDLRAILRGLATLSILTGRAIVVPDLPCSLPWISESGWGKPSSTDGGEKRGGPLLVNADFMARGPEGEARCTWQHFMLAGCVSGPLHALMSWEFQAYKKLMIERGVDDVLPSHTNTLRLLASTQTPLEGSGGAGGGMSGGVEGGGGGGGETDQGGINPGAKARGVGARLRGFGAGSQISGGGGGYEGGGGKMAGEGLRVYDELAKGLSGAVVASGQFHMEEVVASGQVHTEEVVASGQVHMEEVVASRQLQEEEEAGEYGLGGVGGGSGQGMGQRRKKRRRRSGAGAGGLGQGDSYGAHGGAGTGGGLGRQGSQGGAMRGGGGMGGGLGRRGGAGSGMGGGLGRKVGPGGGMLGEGGQGGRIGGLGEGGGMRQKKRRMKRKRGAEVGGARLSGGGDEYGGGGRDGDELGSSGTGGAFDNLYRRSLLVEGEAGNQAGTLERAAGNQAGTLERAAGNQAGTLERAAGNQAGTLESEAGTQAGTLESVAGDQAGTMLYYEGEYEYYRYGEWDEYDFAHSAATSGGEHEVDVRAWNDGEEREHDSDGEEEDGYGEEESDAYGSDGGEREVDVRAWNYGAEYESHGEVGEYDDAHGVLSAATSGGEHEEDTQLLDYVDEYKHDRDGAEEEDMQLLDYVDEYEHYSNGGEHEDEDEHYSDGGEHEDEDENDSYGGEHEEDNYGDEYESNGETEEYDGASVAAAARRLKMSEGAGPRGGSFEGGLGQQGGFGQLGGLGQQGGSTSMFAWRADAGELYQELEKYKDVQVLYLMRPLLLDFNTTLTPKDNKDIQAAFAQIMNACFVLKPGTLANSEPTVDAVNTTYALSGHLSQFVKVWKPT
eukprot:gene6334-2960_t